MISATEALAKVLENIKEVCDEQVMLADAQGRVLAQDVAARLTQPWADVSSMDGYAVRAADVAEYPVTLEVIGESPAGGAYGGHVGAGQAVRIFTGAPVPNGADAIVIQEDAERDGNKVHVREGAPKGKFIRPAGMDFKTGEALIKAPKVLNFRDIGLAAAANVPWLTVKRRPRVGIVATGNELVQPGDAVGPNQIVGSNSVMLAAFIRAQGGEPVDLGLARDDEDSLARLLRSAREVDLLVTSGGASVGEYDLMNKVLGQEGVELGFYKVAVRPGKPLIFGRLHGTLVLGMPGNPVAVGVTSVVLLGPMLRAMLGLETSVARETAILGCDVGQNDVRQDYLRAKLAVNDDGGLVATPFAKQDSAMLAAFTAADCLVIRPPFAAAARIGETVEIIRL